MVTKLMAGFRKKMQVGYEYESYVGSSIEYRNMKDTFAEDAKSVPLVPVRYPEVQYHNKKYNRHTLKKTLWKGEEEAMIFPREDASPDDMPKHLPESDSFIDVNKYKSLLNFYDETGLLRMGATPRAHNGIYKEYVQVHEFMNYPEHEYMKDGLNFFGDSWEVQAEKPVDYNDTKPRRSRYSA
jgi:hypothetical protein